MLNHPDPVIQSLFDDITEQRDIAMVKNANLVTAVKTLQKRIEELEQSQGKEPGEVVVQLHPEPDEAKAA